MMERIEELRKPIGKALSLIAAGVDTFGKWPSPGRNEAEQKFAKGQMDAIAKTYAVACIDEEKITPEIVEMTSYRFLQGKVTVFKDGTHIPLTNQFPSAPQFRDACLQTWYSTYQRLVVGTTKNELGYDVDHTIILRRNLPAKEIERAIESARKSLGLPTPQLSAPMLPENIEKAKRMIAKTFGDAPANWLNRSDEDDRKSA